MSAPSTLVRVAVPVPLADAFDYSWPESTPPPARGCRVVVPLGTGQRIGVVLNHPEHTDLKATKIKSVLNVLDEEPVLNEELLSLLTWCADYYHHPIGEVINQALPVLLRQGRNPKRRREETWMLTDEGLSLAEERLPQLGRRQVEVLELLQHSSSANSRELRDAGLGREVLRRMQERGWVKATKAPPPPGDYATDSPPRMTQEQERCLSSIASDGYHAYLLQGVTGSGKTEVYMQLISQQLKAGRQSLLLVPEIGLTPQLVKRLKNRFGPGLAVMHSGLAAGQRLDAWQDTRSGTAKLIVGTRSAIFAPLVNAGLIILDEEHDPSYKQQDGFRYSARDLAVLRARRLNIPIVLASATPSLESIHNADRGRYQLLTMKHRIGSAGDPQIRIIDMRHHARRHDLSTPLIAAIERHLSDEHQVLLFLNRRGFAPVLLCTACGIVEECDRCDARLTLHPASGHLRCHHCGRTRPLSWSCPDCGTERLAAGAGTQRVTDELRALFPEARIARLDRDTASGKGSLETILADVERGETQVLVGTQMLTKGHDFPRVTLVGVLSADQGLFGTDFRSSERLAQILLQVAGRAGRRSRPGEVLIQSHYPEHPLLAHLAAQDYDAFSKLALAEREAAAWPPFSHLIVWRAEATRREPAHALLQRLAADAQGAVGAEVKILGPAAPSMERRGGRYRAQLLFQSRYRTPLHDLIRELLLRVRSWPEARRVRWSIDVDPSEL